MTTLQWYLAAWTWTISQVPDSDHKNSVTEWSTDRQTVEVHACPLLFVITRVSKDPRIKPALDTITTFAWYTVLISMQELIIQKQLPLLMGQFTMAV
jgi:hypothetical protein